ncbi:MAG: hypothetical protein AAF690_26965 [Acidobacteriota bacterium]
MRSSAFVRSFPLVVASLACLLAASIVAAPSLAQDDIPRRPDGKPDLSGNYDIASLTPFERPEMHGDKQFMTPEEAAQIEKAAAAGMAFANRASDPNREAPPPGGDGSGGAAGDVGGYNAFWIDPGSKTYMVDGKFRTSILYDPPNGRLPALTEEGKARRAAARPYVFKNTGTAWWLDDGAEEGPYDGPESLATIERCLYPNGLLPSRPVLYNNLHTIVQTDTHLMILIEWMHEARIIRLDQEPAPEGLRSLSGDSVGRWEGDTLVVETTNFQFNPVSQRDYKLTERFTRTSQDTLLYDFTVEDADYEVPYSGQFTWPQTQDKLYEYACHEGNYAMGGILRGARLLEKETREGQTSGDD